MARSPRATPGRPRNFEVTAVLDRAVDVLWSDGFRGATSRRLGDALGLSQSSLYHLFGSKVRLQELALDRYEHRTVTALLEPLEQETAGLDALRTFLHDLAAWVSEGDRAGCMVINLMTDEPDAFRARTSAYRARVRDVLAGALARCVRRGELVGVDPAVHADVLFAQVLAINLVARTRDAEALQRQLDGALRLLDDWAA